MKLHSDHNFAGIAGKMSVNSNLPGRAMISRRVFVSGALVASATATLVPLWPRRGSGEVIPSEPWAQKLVNAAENQIGVTVIYDPAYRRIAFPGGDFPRAFGVCTDVVIRAYRDGLGLDLQRLVHDDMVEAFSDYPKTWGLKKPDTNIDHRRVPNLQTFFRRRGAALEVSQSSGDYRPGDLVTQMVGGTRPHIGIVSNRMNEDASRPLMIHNIGWGARAEDVLFALPVTGHYRFSG